MNLNYTDAEQAGNIVTSFFCAINRATTYFVIQL